MTADLTPQTPRELVELWASTASARLRAEQATPGSLTGTELNRLGELAISAATWLSNDAKALKDQIRLDRIEAMKRSPEYAAMSMADQMRAMVNA